MSGLGLVLILCFNSLFSIITVHCDVRGGVNFFIKSGEDVEFVTNIFERHVDDYNWFKVIDGVEIPITDKDKMVLEDSRISLKIGGSYLPLLPDLVIENASLSDSGVYKLAYTYKKNYNNVHFRGKRTISKSYVLDVYEDSADVYKVLAGDSVAIKCFESTSKLINIGWSTKQKSQLSEGFGDIFISLNNTLLIPSTAIADSGTYQCFAMANSYKIPLKTKTLKVFPEVEVITRNDVLTRTKGSQVTLVCLINSLYPVQVDWYRYDKGTKRLLQNSTHTLMKVNTYDDAYITGELTLTDLSENDYGAYVCKVTNQFGSIHKKIELTPSL